MDTQGFPGLFSLLPGDRLQVWPDPYDLHLGLLLLDEAWATFLNGEAGIELETPDGLLHARFDSAGGALESADLDRAFPDAGAAQYHLEVVRAAPPRFRVVSVPLAGAASAGDAGGETPDRPEGSRAAPDVEATPTPGPADVRSLVGAAARGRFGALAAYRIGRAAWRLSLAAGFDRLLCLPLLRSVDPLDHQIKTVQTVLRRHRARALLCDEVGLGKTIEAGMILLELTVRRLVRRVLVLTPPSLVSQWHGELQRKFGLDFVTQDAPEFAAAGAEAWGRFERVIASFHTAKREPHRAAILRNEYDLVIIDEAHHLRNRNTVLWRFAGALRKRFMLLLTATPIQNRLEDIFNLITVLKPGYLSTARSFRRDFVAREGIVPRNLDRLQGALSEVMVRNRRSQAGVRFTRRIARTLEIALPPTEAAFYRDVSRTVRTSFRAGTAMGRMALRTLQAEAGSSPAATRSTLGGLAGRPDLPPDVRARLADLRDRADGLGPGAKAGALIDLLRETSDPMVVFTRFRATLDLLARRLDEAGIPTAVFHGSLPRRERQEALRRFEQGARVLLSSEAGSEGRNLQFCHAVCNYDLPWNPMVLEQRIGRLSRIGQRHDVLVYNLVAAGTLESHILRLLDVKLRMFELVVGEIDMVLGNLESEEDFEDRVLNLWVASEDDRAFVRHLDRLSDELLRAKEAYVKTRAYDDALFGDRFAPEG
jgi:SNF2 family DNA or RNA helicase